MHHATHPAPRLRHASALVLLALLSACGGTENSVSCTGTSSIMLVQCDPPAATTPPPSQPAPPPPATAPTDPVRTVVINRVSEFEPNDEAGNANPLSFPSAAPDQSLGVEISGRVGESGDTADFFVFTPPRSGQYMAYLCADTCSDFARVEGVYLMAYDQQLTTFASTPLDPTRDQVMFMELDAGLAYYLEINGQQAAGATLDYTLVLIQ